MELSQDLPSSDEVRELMKIRLKEMRPDMVFGKNIYEKNPGKINISTPLSDYLFSSDPGILSADTESGYHAD